MQDHPKISSSEIWFFKPLDVLMSQYKTKEPAYFCELFQRKKQIIQFLQQGKIDAAKYLSIVKKMYKGQGSQKKYAQLDLVDFKQINNSKVDEWFQDKVQETGMDFQDQQSFYNKFNNTLSQQSNKKSQVKNQPNKSAKQQKPKQPQKIVQQKPKPKQETQLSSFNPPPFFVVGELISMKALDHYLDKFCQHKNIYLQIFEKKKKMVQFVQTKKIDGEKYKGLIQRVNSTTPNLQLKDLISTDLNMLNDLYENNTNTWFESLSKDSIYQYQLQKQIYQKHLKGIPVKRIDKNADLNISGMTQQQEDNAVQPAQCFTFRVFDQFMEKNQSNPVLYVALYQKKIKFLQLVKKGQLNPAKYKALIKKGLTSTKNDKVKMHYQMDLQQIDDIHQGNMNQWFAQIMDITKGNSMLQEDRYPQMKQQAKKAAKQIIKSQAQKPKKVDSNKIIQQKPSKKQSKMSVQINFDIQKMFSLRVLDDALLEHSEDDELFIRLFNQKQKIIDMEKNGELDGKKYLKMQQKLVNQTFQNNQEIKEAIQKDILNLKEMHDGNLQQWFNQIAESAGLQYQSQLERFNQLKSEQTTDNNNVPDNSHVVGPAQKVQKPNLPQILCFTVINKAFTVFSDDVQFIQGLKQKYIKFTAWVKQGKLDAQKYQLMCKKIQDSTTNQWLKANMKIQRERLSSQFNGNQQKWFKQLTKVLKEANRNSKTYSSIVSNAEDQINQSSSKGKIRYYLNHLAGYQSICKYQKNNKINPSKNQLVKIYLTVARKQIDQIIQKIKEQPQFDVVGYCKRLLPEINQINFHQSIQIYQQKLLQYIGSYQSQISNYKEYVKKIKKSTNSNNLEKIKKKITQCEENIKYLDMLSKNPKKLIPIPDLVQEKVDWFNMDQYKLEPNEVQIIITSAEGFQSERILKLYVCGKQSKQFEIHQGQQKISTKVKVTQNQMNDIFKGQTNYFSFHLCKKGWFSSSDVGSANLQLQFIRANASQGKCTIDSVTIYYQGRVKMAKKPLTTEIMQYTLNKFPAYEHSKQAEDQFQKKYKI